MADAHKHHVVPGRCQAVNMICAPTVISGSSFCKGRAAGRFIEAVCESCDMEIRPECFCICFADAVFDERFRIVLALGFTINNVFFYKKLLEDLS